MSGGCEATGAPLAYMCVCVWVRAYVTVQQCVFAACGFARIPVHPRSILCAHACVEVRAGQHIVPQMFDILCIRGWLEWEDKHVSDRGIVPPQSATSAM